MKVATIINFCSNEYPFLKYCIYEAQKFSAHIHIAMADHFFDGQKENLEELKAVATEFSKVNFFLFPFVPGNFFGKYSPSDTTHMWHNIPRMISYSYLPKDIDYVLFLDADEIVDGDHFKEWLKTFPCSEYNFLKLSCYWYFREPRYQAKQLETSPLLAKRSALSSKLIMQKDERSGLFTQGKGKKLEGVLGLNEKPLVHHYSWVRTKEEMLRKVRTWGHKGDRNWEELVEKEFSGDFQGKDFVHGYEFVEVSPFVSLNLKERPAKFSGKKLENFRSFNLKELKKIIRRSFFNLHL